MAGTKNTNARCFSLKRKNISKDKETISIIFSIFLTSEYFIGLYSKTLYAKIPV